MKGKENKEKKKKTSGKTGGEEMMQAAGRKGMLVYLQMVKLSLSVPATLPLQ